MATNRAQGGYMIITDPHSREPVKERDTFTCFHCNNIVIIDKAVPDTLGGFCRLCMKNICTHCADHGACTPFEKKLEQMEAQDRFRRALGG